jgi:hypothetical protein
MRITKGNLENVLSQINTQSGAAAEAWTQNAEGTWRANVGTYVLDYCYGGVRLGQLCNESGGQRDITYRGTKKETYYRMHAFLRGLEAASGNHHNRQP